MPATWPAPTIGICMHCGLTVVRTGRLDDGADAWTDKTASPVCVPPGPWPSTQRPVMHKPLPAGFGLRGGAR